MKPDQNKDATNPTAADKRRPYKKPAFRHERVFETMALGCGKLGGGGGPCTFAPKVS